MQQRQPIKVDRGRAFSAQNGPASSSTQVSFHKIYRKKRCYSLVDKEQEGHGSSQWRAGSMNSQRDNNTGLRNNHSSGSSSLKPIRRVDSIKSNSNSSYSVSSPYRESAKNYRQHLKRPNDRLGCNSLSGEEFDVPFVKRQKVENYKFQARQPIISPETGQDKQKVVLEETKWMYRNQHAKMSGPYGVRQLMEGFHARFLQEDLPIYQFHEGKLCKPIMLKQLIDDLESCNSPMHNLVTHQSFPEEGFHQAAAPCKVVKDMDLPPGFGGGSVQHSERPSCIHMPTSAAPRKRYVGASAPSLPDFGVAELDLPPGFEAAASTASLIEPHTSELPGSSRRLSQGAGVAVRSEGTEGMRKSYEKFEPVIHGQGHSSYQSRSRHSKMSFTMQGLKSSSCNSMLLEPVGHGWGHPYQQDSSPPSRVNFTVQGARTSNENSNRHTTWGSASPNTRVSNIEAQTLSSPTVCIGLPVSKPAVQNWPFGNNLPIAYAHADIGLLPKEYSEFPVTYGPNPLALIHLELLAAVKRSYIKTILSALIDEQLQCWIDGKDTMVKSLLPEDGSHSREASSLSSAEFGVMCVESHTFENGASTSLRKHHNRSQETSFQVRAAESFDGSCVNVNVGGSAETSLELRAAQCFDGSGLNNQSICIGAYQCPSVEAFSTRCTGNLHTPFTVTDVTDTEQNSLNGTSKVPFIKKSAELELDKAEFFFSCDEASKLCFKSSSFVGNGVDKSKQVFVDQKQDVQHLSGDEIHQGEGAVAGKIQSSGDSYDAALLETEPSFLVSGKKKWKIKSLKHLMQITSKLQPRHSRISLSMNKKEEKSIVMVPEAPERRLQNGVLIPKGYDGCARTSFDGWLCCKLARHAPHSEGFQRDSSTYCTQLTALRAQTHHAQRQTLSAAADSSFIFKVAQSEVKLKLARSKIHGWGVFAIEFVKVGDFIIEYVGEVVRPRVSDTRERHYRNLGIGNGFLFHVDDETVVDATKRGGLARFMNYSCDPNCSAKMVTVEGAKKVYFYAKRHITAGEELTYECKFQLEDQKIPCNCGSTMCQGSSLMDNS